MRWLFIIVLAILVCLVLSIIWMNPNNLPRDWSPSQRDGGGFNAPPLQPDRIDMTDILDF